MSIIIMHALSMQWNAQMFPTWVIMFWGHLRAHHISWRSLGSWVNFTDFLFRAYFLRKCTATTTWLTFIIHSPEAVGRLSHRNLIVSNCFLGSTILKTLLWKLACNLRQINTFDRSRKGDLMFQPTTNKIRVAPFQFYKASYIPRWRNVIPPSCKHRRR